MYNELKTKCEETKAELLAIKPDLVDGGCIKDYKSGKLIDVVNAAARELSHVISTIDTYYSE